MYLRGLIPEEAVITRPPAVPTMSTSAASRDLTMNPTPPAGWMRSGPFDLFFIFGVAALALATGGVVVLKPQWFTIILLLDLWLLGYHHVVSTFTRISFDKSSFREHRFLVIILPWIVLVATLAVGLTVGLWALATTYLYWQWFHYTRQSYGIARIYGRKAGPAAAGEMQATVWALYLIPLWGILHRSHQSPKKFLGMELVCLPTHRFVVYVAGAAAVASLLIWTLRQWRAARAGRLSVALTLYALSHFVIFYVGYLYIEHITYGWLVINVWHNAQYILLVWSYNNNRFKQGVDPEHKFLSVISQRQVKNILAYGAVCLAISSVFYGVLQLILNLELNVAAIPLAVVIVYQTVNFHHYIVDGLIWKVRKKQLQKHLGIAA